MNILENQLVKKYFGCYAFEIKCTNGNEYLEHMAYRILQAMQEPIKKGERCLFVDKYGDDQHRIIPESHSILRIQEYTAEKDFLDAVHLGLWRLPDCFQRRECSCACHLPGNKVMEGSPCCQPQRDDIIDKGFDLKPKNEVEEKIKYLLSVSDHSSDWESHLRDLVRLAREGK